MKRGTKYLRRQWQSPLWDDPGRAGGRRALFFGQHLYAESWRWPRRGQRSTRGRAAICTTFLERCKLVSSVEPCCMGAWACFLAVIGTVVYGLSERPLAEFMGATRRI